MGIINAIQKQKENFQRLRQSVTLKKINRETEQLKAEKIKQGEIARANADKQKALRDVQSIKSYNAKVEGQTPNKLKQFGEGLAKVINQAKTQEKKDVKSGFKGNAVKKLNKINTGSHSDLGNRGFNFGGGGSSPFNTGTSRNVFSGNDKPRMNKPMRQKQKSIF